MARASGGRFLLRIEDIDTARCREEFEQAIYRDLAWLGLTWEQPVRRQSRHFDDYRASLAQLDALGLVYPAFESRGEVARLVAARETQAPWPRDPDGVPLYPGMSKCLSLAERHRRIAAGEPYALRLDMTAALARAGTICLEPKPAAVLQARPASSRRTRRPGATSSWPARRRRRAITSPWWLTMPARVSAMWCAGRTCSGRPACTACCRSSSVCPHRSSTTIAWCWMPRAEKLSKSTRATSLRALRQDGATPADIRRMVSLA